MREAAWNAQLMQCLDVTWTPHPTPPSLLQQGNLRAAIYYVPSSGLRSERTRVHVHVQERCVLAGRSVTRTCQCVGAMRIGSGTSPRDFDVFCVDKPPVVCLVCAVQRGVCSLIGARQRLPHRAGAAVCLHVFIMQRTSNDCLQSDGMRVLCRFTAVLAVC